MAMNLNFQNNSEQFNKTIEQIISLLMNKTLMKDRFAGYRGLDEARGQRGMDLERFKQQGAAERLGRTQEGDVALQGIKHEGAMEKVKQEYINTVSRDPEIKRLSSLVFTGRQAGEDVTAIGGELEARLRDVARATANTFQGELSGEDAYSLLANVGEESVRKLVGTAQDMKRMKDVDIPSMKTQRMVAETSKGNLKQKWADMNVDNLKDQVTRNLDTIHRTQDFLKTEGIKKEGGLSLGSLKALLGGSSGRLPDPLTSENRGAAFEWLAEIELNLNANKLPSEIDKRFMKAVKNTFRIQGAEEKTVERGVATVTGTPGEGLPTRESQGFTPAEFGRQQTAATDQVKVAEIARIKERLIADALTRGKITQAQVAGLDSLFQRRAEEVYIEDQR